MPARDKATNDALASRLRTLREAAGLSRRALAELSGVPFGTLLAIEQGESLDPRLSTAVALARALGVSMETLAGFVYPAE